jgi:hypothetical protein
MQSGKGEQIFFKASEHGPAVLMLEVGGLPVEQVVRSLKANLDNDDLTLKRRT